MVEQLLDIKDLSVTFRQKDKKIKAVDGVNLSIGEGEVFGHTDQNHQKECPV